MQELFWESVLQEKAAYSQEGKGKLAMFITTSRNAGLLQKRVCKLFGVLFCDVRHIPRGDTAFKKLFDDSKYLGYKQFLIVSKEKNEIVLEVYCLWDCGYILDGSYKLKDVSLRQRVSLARLRKLPASEKPELKELLSGATENTDRALTIKTTGNKRVFLFEGQLTGISFNLEKM